jgi:hypothetical protein
VCELGGLMARVRAVPALRVAKLRRAYRRCQHPLRGGRLGPGRRGCVRVPVGAWVHSVLVRAIIFRYFGESLHAELCRRAQVVLSCGVERAGRSKQRACSKSRPVQASLPRRDPEQKPNLLPRSANTPILGPMSSSARLCLGLLGGRPCVLWLLCASLGGRSATRNKALEFTGISQSQCVLF